MTQSIKHLTRRELLQLGAAAATAGLSRQVDAQAPATPTGPLRMRGLFLHAWDLRDDGVDRVLGWV